MNVTKQKSIYEIYREKSNKYLETFYRECIFNSDKAIEFLELTEKCLLNLLKINEVLLDYLDKMDDVDITIELYKTYDCNVTKLKTEFETVAKMYVIDNEPIFNTISATDVTMYWNSYSQIDNGLTYKISWTKPEILFTSGFFNGFSLLSTSNVETYYYTDDRSEITSNLTSNTTILETDKESLKDYLKNLGAAARDIKSKKDSYELLLNSLL